MKTPPPDGDMEDTRVANITELQQELLFTAAVAQASKEADAAKALIAFLRSPAAAAVIEAKGMNPG